MIIINNNEMIIINNTLQKYRANECNKRIGKILFKMYEQNEEYIRVSYG